MSAAKTADILRFAWIGVATHRLRSIMTALGIVIGVASVISISAVVEGLSRSITHDIDSLGTNSLSVRSYTPLDEQLRGVENHLDVKDFERVLRAVGTRGDVSPTFSPFGLFGTVVKSGRNSNASNVAAVTERYQDANRLYVEQGRFLGAGDNISRRKVCVVGTALLDHLGIKDKPIGRFIQVADEWFKIVGVMQERGDVFGISQDDYVLIPYSVGESLIGSQTEKDIVININVHQGISLDEVADDIRGAMHNAHREKVGGEDIFKVQTAKQLRETVDNITSAVSFALVGVVAISVLVGGIGIMNIMLVSVTERTKEVGISKAIGAQRSDILLQFLAEAVFISGMGGMIGLAAGVLITLCLSLIIPFVSVANIPLWAIALSLLFSFGVGVIFGVLPALKASNLAPVDALRFE